MTKLISTTAALALLLLASTAAHAQSFQLRTTRQTGRTGIAISLNRGHQIQHTGYYPRVNVYPSHRYPGHVSPSYPYPGVDSYPVQQYPTCHPVYPYAPTVVPYSTGYHHRKRVQLADGTFVIIE